jgi:hypothetical protein
MFFGGTSFPDLSYPGLNSSYNENIGFALKITYVSDRACPDRT